MKNSSEMSLHLTRSKIVIITYFYCPMPFCAKGKKALNGLEMDMIRRQVSMIGSTVKPQFTTPRFTVNPDLLHLQSFPHYKETVLPSQSMNG